MKLSIGITGCTGSLGKTLIKLKKDIIYKCFTGDIRNKLEIKKWFLNNSFDAVIHLAAIVPIKDVNSNKRKAYEVNYIGTKNIIDNIVKSNVSWFFSSTSHVYKSRKNKIKRDKKQPISYYGYTKLLAEEYITKKLKKTKTKYCIGRIFSTSNKDQKRNYLVPDLKKRIKSARKKVLFKNLNHYRDFISMDEISKIILTLYKKKFQGIVNIGNGKKIHLKEIAKIICIRYQKNLNLSEMKNQHI